jgi:hypothetical protein
MTIKPNLTLLACLVLLAVQMCAQGTGSDLPPQQTEEADRNRSSFAVAGYGYIIPDDQSYFSPSIDRLRYRFASNDAAASVHRRNRRTAFS